MYAGVTQSRAVGRGKESNLRKKQIQYEKEGGGDQGRQMETKRDRQRGKDIDR